MGLLSNKVFSFQSLRDRGSLVAARDNIEAGAMNDLNSQLKRVEHELASIRSAHLDAIPFWLQAIIDICLESGGQINPEPSLATVERIFSFSFLRSPQTLEGLFELKLRPSRAFNLALFLLKPQSFKDSARCGALVFKALDKQLMIKTLIVCKKHAFCIDPLW